MATNYPNYAPPPNYAQPPGYAQSYPQHYPPAPVVAVVTPPQPASTNVNNVVVVNTQNDDVQHGCHFLLCLITGGLWAPCWIGACCGCCCRRPC